MSAATESETDVDYTDDEWTAIVAAWEALQAKTKHREELEAARAAKAGRSAAAQDELEKARELDRRLRLMSPYEKTVAMAEGRDLPTLDAVQKRIAAAADRLRAISDVASADRLVIDESMQAETSARKQLARALSEPARRRLVARLLADPDLAFLLRCAGFLHNGDGPAAHVAGDELRISGREFRALQHHRVHNITWLLEQVQFADDEDDEPESDVAPTGGDEPDVKLEDDTTEAA